MQHKQFSSAVCASSLFVGCVGTNVCDMYTSLSLRGNQAMDAPLRARTSMLPCGILKNDATCRAGGEKMKRLGEVFFSFFFLPYLTEPRIKARSGKEIRGNISFSRLLLFLLLSMMR